MRWLARLAVSGRTSSILPERTRIPITNKKAIEIKMIIEKTSVKTWPKESVKPLPPKPWRILQAVASLQCLEEQEVEVHGEDSKGLRVRP